MQNLITNADIVGRLSVVTDFIDTVITATVTTITSIKAKEEEMSNWHILFLSGVNKGIDSIILSNDVATGIVTLTTPLPTAPSPTDEIAYLKTGYTRYAENAMDILTEDFKNVKIDIDLFLTPTQLKELQLIKTLSLICLDKFQDGVAMDLYYRRYEEYSKRYDEMFNNIKADYDGNKNSKIDDDEKNFSKKRYGVMIR